MHAPLQPVINLQACALAPCNHMYEHAPKVRGCDEADGDDSRRSNAGGRSAERNRDRKGIKSGILLLYCLYIHTVTAMLCSEHR